jgi:hypothetical protein
VTDKRRWIKYVFVYVLIVGAVALVPFWKYVDFALLGQMLGEDRTLDPELVAIDLNAHLGHVRPPLADVLEAICRPANAAAAELTCTRPYAERPKLVVLDVEFIANRGDQRIVDRLVRDIKALRAANMRVYGAVLPSNDPGDQSAQRENERAVEKIYSLLSGYGHTELFVIPFLQGFAWYEPTVDFPNGSRMEALPLNIVKSARQSSQPTAVKETRIVPIGSHRDFLQSVHSYPLPATYQFTNDDWVLVGDILGEREVAAKQNGVNLGERTGFELLAWALDDEKKRTETDTTNGATRFEPHVDAGLLVILLLLFSALAVAAYRYAFARLKTRRYCFTLSLAAALGVTFGAFVLLELVLFANHQLFARVSLIAVGIVTAGALTARWTVSDVRHERFLTSLWASAAQGRNPPVYDVFISYARDPENAKWVEENVYEPLSRTLGPDGRPLRIFLDREVLSAGHDWYQRIVQAIYGSKRFVAIYSAGYFDRWFCRDELELAMLRSSGGSQFIVPVSRVGSAIPKRYGAIQFVDAGKPGFLDEVIRSIRTADEEVHA